MRECQFIQVSCFLSLVVIYFGLLFFVFLFEKLKKKSVHLIMIVVDTRGTQEWTGISVQNDSLTAILTCKDCNYNSGPEFMMMIIEKSSHKLFKVSYRLQLREVVKNGLFMVRLAIRGGIFSYCVRARAYTHVLARVYSTRASTCTIYTC